MERALFLNLSRLFVSGPHGRWQDGGWRKNGEESDDRTRLDEVNSCIHIRRSIPERCITTIASVKRKPFMGPSSVIRDGDTNYFCYKNHNYESDWFGRWRPPVSGRIQIMWLTGSLSLPPSSGPIFCCHKYIPATSAFLLAGRTSLSKSLSGVSTMTPRKSIEFNSQVIFKSLAVSLTIQSISYPRYYKLYYSLSSAGLNT